MRLYVQFDCAFPRDHKFRAAGPLGRIVYVEAAMFCRENLTDGVIHRLNLVDFAVDVPNKKRHMAKLVEVGALEEIDVGWKIPEHVWRQWNPLKSEVDEKRQAEAERKAEYRRRRRESSPSPNGADSDVPPGQAVAARDKSGTRANSHSHSHREEEEPHLYTKSSSRATVGERRKSRS